MNESAITAVTSEIPMTSQWDNNIITNTYISDDERVKNLFEYKLATWIDYIYVPLCSGLGIIGNCLSFTVLQSPRLSGSSTSVYMAALSVSDSLVQVVNILFLANKFPGHEVLRHGTCGFVYFLLYFSIHFNVIVMMGMTLERYVAIRFPLKASVWCMPRRARMAVLVMCALTLGIDAHHVFIRKMVWNEERKEEVCAPEGSSAELFVSKVWPWVDGTLYCYLPFISLLVLNVLIVRRLKSAARFRGNSASTEQNDANRQVTSMLLLVTCTFLLLVGPMALLIVAERYYWTRDTPREKAVYHLTRVLINNLSYTNHAINFCLYCLSGNRFRKEFLRIFCGCVPKTNTEDNGKDPHSSLACSQKTTTLKSVKQPNSPHRKQSNENEISVIA